MKPGNMEHRKLFTSLLKKKITKFFSIVDKTTLDLIGRNNMMALT